MRSDSRISVKVFQGSLWALVTFLYMSPSSCFDLLHSPFRLTPLTIRSSLSYIPFTLSHVSMCSSCVFLPCCVFTICSTTVHYTEPPTTAAIDLGSPFMYVITLHAFSVIPSTASYTCHVFSHSFRVIIRGGLLFFSIHLSGYTRPYLMCENVIYRGPRSCLRSDRDDETWMICKRAGGLCSNFF